ncbi:unnamed protein product [Urochloa humidicola]
MVVYPANATVIAPTAARVAAAGHAVRVHRCPFPDVSLGDGVECLTTAPARDAWRVYRAMEPVRPAHESLLREHRPDAIIFDVPFVDHGNRRGARYLAPHVPPRRRVPAARHEQPLHHALRDHPGQFRRRRHGRVCQGRTSRSRCPSSLVQDDHLSFRCDAP